MICDARRIAKLYPVRAYSKYGSLFTTNWKWVTVEQSYGFHLCILLAELWYGIYETGITTVRFFRCIVCTVISCYICCFVSLLHVCLEAIRLGKILYFIRTAFRILSTFVINVKCLLKWLHFIVFLFQLSVLLPLIADSNTWVEFRDYTILIKE